MTLVWEVLCCGLQVVKLRLFIYCRKPLPKLRCARIDKLMQLRPRTIVNTILQDFAPTARCPARRIMRPSDRALFDGEVFDRESTLSGYDNPSNRRFAFGPLSPWD